MALFPHFMLCKDLAFDTGVLAFALQPIGAISPLGVILLVAV